MKYTNKNQIVGLIFCVNKINYRIFDNVISTQVLIDYEEKKRRAGGAIHNVKDVINNLNNNMWKVVIPKEIQYEIY